MRVLKQIVAVTWLNLRNLPQRVGSSVVAVIGVAAVVLVFAAVLSMAKGFERTMISAGSDDTAIIMRSGSTSELNSGISNDQALIVANAPGVLKDGDSAVISAELYVVVDVKKKSTNTDANVPFRGIQSGAFAVRNNVAMVEGRMFETGKNEIIVGRAAQQEFAGLDTGSTIRFGQTEWQIVGVFEAQGSVSESELWTDVRVLQNAYRRGNFFQSVRAKLQSSASLPELEAALEADPRIDPDVMSEREYYSGQAEPLSRFIKLIGYPLTILMSIGAVFGALNSMYSSVSVRGKEIATLRALGFGPISILFSTMIESTLLALVGGVVGGAIAFLAFNGFQVSTLNGASFSQVVFDFAVTPDLLINGLYAALIIGAFGGLFPAIRAARLPVAQALREL
ncbi:MAG: ABC transporter permease [Gammaproteobacteria bacterium]|nr:ABC transporter permease [Gammaproteobacteria bacterium]MDH3363025.1 ABC transporter permease [Gammaproteobacteria bacterium]MDH3481185.1 ABC transporter permease [Gammaproteobacteria bacterium]